MMFFFEGLFNDVIPKNPLININIRFKHFFLSSSLLHRIHLFQGE